MYQLTQARHDLPPAYWRCITDEIETYLARSLEEQRTLPSLIIEPKHAYEYEEGVAPYEQWSVDSFGLYLAVRWLGHSFAADAEPGDKLPRRLIDEIRLRIGPGVPREDLEEFKGSLVDLSYSGLSNASSQWWDLADVTVTWPNFDPGVPVPDLFNDFWHDHAATVFEWLHACRVSHLEVRTTAFENLYGADYDRDLYDDYIDGLFDPCGLEIVRPEAYDESDPEQVALLYRYPVRGGGFSCMR